MLFQCKWNNASYIIRRTERIIIPGLGTDLKPGLRAEFTGPNRLFDSEQAQEKYGWTDEEREFVEERLFRNKDFGNGLYLSGGAEVPEKYRKDPKIAKKLRSEKTRCVHVEFINGTVNQCEEEAMVGGNKCATHRDDAVRISKGLSTT